MDAVRSREIGSPWTAPDVPARSGRSILLLPVLVVVRGIQRSVRLPAQTTMQRSYMPCTNTTAFCPKSHLPSVTAWGVILWLLDSRRVWVSLHGMALAISGSDWL